MVCTANDLLGWKDFPKGLRVLFLEEDEDYASEVKAKLEEMDYVVSVFTSEKEALLAISSKADNYHVAIVEVNADNSNGRYKFLESAKDLPTIMTSDMHCLSTMMKCIALGAVEFLKKPVSEEKLKNIWQHVVHKAFNAGGQVDLESKLKIEPVETEKEVSIESETLRLQEGEQDLLSHSDKFPAPSTPQIKQSGRFLDDVDYHDQTNSSTDKDNGEHEQDGETFKSVETTIVDSSVVNAKDVDAQPPQRPTEAVVKEENHHCCVDGVGIPDGFQNVNNISEQLRDKRAPMVIAGAIENPERETISSNASGGSRSRAAGNRKKAKVDWTHDLHKKFVQAVEQLGLEQAIPSRILELMKVEGLTRHNVASHLQKYRMQRRHILPKEDERRWPQPRASLQRAYYPRQGPVMAFPPYHPIHSYSASPFYPMWGESTTNQPQNIKLWAPPAYPWNPMENWLWKPYTGLHADAWGCPVMPTPQCPRSTIPESSSTILGVHSHGNYGMPRNPADLQAGMSLGLGMEEEVIDKVVSEAISMPWLPLPIGLKSPSTESVLAELSKQGISTVPPNSINDQHRH